MGKLWARMSQVGAQMDEFRAQMGQFRTQMGHVDDDQAKLVENFGYFSPIHVCVIPHVIYFFSTDTHHHTYNVSQTITFYLIPKLIEKLLFNISLSFKDN